MQGEPVRRGHAETALKRVAAYSSLNRVPLTDEAARRILSDLLPGSRPRIVTPQASPHEHH